MIGDLVAHGDAAGSPNRYDWQTRWFYRRRRIATWYTWPSLVDHRRGPSLLDHSNRQAAWRFIGVEASALQVNWSLPPYIVP
ncbi:MAG: hypothetical protein ACODAF_04450, partial [Actinomycetota bacterium]